ncbi:MAG TPA: hypothetical protein VL992_07015 [Tepidisphaeraceae bacterium]|nr:hypothetical protein [Tepidisphaeraceae bacterium]
MEAFKISIKLYAERDGFGPSDFVPVFQHWIQTQALPDHLLIDVADYAHVPDGPGTVLVTSQANLYTDRGDGRLGLLYSRKLPLEGTFFDRLRQVTAAALAAAALLEKEEKLGGRLKFRADELLIRINDRLLAPNTAETLAAVAPDIERLGKMLYGNATYRIDFKPSALKLFEVSVKAQQGPTFQAMAERLKPATSASK